MKSSDLGPSWGLKRDQRAGSPSQTEVGLSQATTPRGRWGFVLGGWGAFVWPEKLEARVADPVFIKCSEAQRPGHAAFLPGSLS